MICEYTVKKFCKDDISLIENYDKAIYDKEQTWDCHHRRELEIPRKELIEKNEYYNRPARELIFLTNSEHRALHNTLKFKGCKLTEETKLKISKANKGKHLSEEAKQKISIANKGNKSWLGRKHSEEAKQKISKALKGRRFTEEWKRKIAEAQKGKHLSEEHKQKMADAMKRLHWFNNGIKNVFVKECPEGFVRGMLKRKAI